SRGRHQFLSADRSPGENGYYEHGAFARSAIAAARSRSCGIRRLAAELAEAPAPHHEISPEESRRRHCAARKPPPPETGVCRTDCAMATSRPERFCRRPSSSIPSGGGRTLPPAGHRRAAERAYVRPEKLRASSLGAADARAVASYLRQGMSPSILHGYDIVCFSSIDWQFIWQGHPEIMLTLA